MQGSTADIPSKRLGQEKQGRAGLEFREGGAETVIFVPNTPGSEQMYEKEVSTEGEGNRECWEVQQKHLEEV